MQSFFVGPRRFETLIDWPEQLPDDGFLWLGFARREFEAMLPKLQSALQRWVGAGIVDLHVSDLLNRQIPSQYDLTSWYDLLLFRRLATASGGQALPADDEPLTQASARDALQAIDTSCVGFVVFERLLITVHPADCSVLQFFAQRLAQQTDEMDVRGTARLPTTPADLMLRMANHMVDGYLNLRRLLSRQMTTIQAELLTPRSHFNDWKLLLATKEALGQLEDTCEDQRSAIQEWIDSLDEWPAATDERARRDHELLRVRSRDVHEHIERVIAHVRRLQQSAEAGVQMHFSLLGQRTNDVMRTLTVLTAIFLPLNLITGIFGMNFDGLPLIHSQRGAWVAFGLMVIVGTALYLLFQRKRYLGEG